MALKVNVSEKHSKAYSGPDTAELNPPPPPSPHLIDISVTIEHGSQNTSQAVRGRKPSMFRYLSTGCMVVMLTDVARIAEQEITRQFGWPPMNPDEVVAYHCASDDLANEKSV